MVATYRHLALLLVLSAACAPPADPADLEPSLVAVTPKEPKHPYIISEEELHDPLILSMDAGRAIRQLRPAFFRRSGPQSFADATAGSVHISLDYGPLQNVNQLGTFGTMTFVEVRYLDINEATNRFGINANGGPVIVLLTRKNQH